MPSTPPPSVPSGTRRPLRELALEALPVPAREGTIARALAARLDVLDRSTTSERRLRAIVGLLSFLRRQDREDQASVEGEEHPRHGRARMFVGLLESSPDVLGRFLGSLGDSLKEVDAENLFGEEGIPRQRGFLSELGHRLTRKVLPVQTTHRDLAVLLEEILPGEGETRLAEEMPADLFHRLVVALAGPGAPPVWDSLRPSFADGFRLLGARVQAEGLSAPMRRGSTRASIADSPFPRFARVSDDLASGWLDGVPAVVLQRAWESAYAACRREITEVGRRLEADGVSLDIVFSIEVIERAMGRMELMAGLMLLPEGPERSRCLQLLVAGLIQSSVQDRSVRHLIAWNLHLLDRRIVDRTGEMGEHYIARNRGEYRRIWGAAAGGGALTGFTAAFKSLLIHSRLALFQEGFLAGLNYAVSFLLLQAWGLMLATKQPAMTAAALGRILKERKGDSRLDDIVEYTTRIVHSQLAAATANVAVVGATAYAIDGLWRLIAGRPYLDAAAAEYVYGSLSPVDSGTVLYAAQTGVILWLASLVGGWFDNFSAYNRIPQGIADHPAGVRLGRERMLRFAERFRRNAGGWATNISLGFMLGLAPAVGSFFGLPVDVRHVTLSSGLLALASASLGHAWFGEGRFLLGLAGVGTMFVLNLSVSFLLSLLNAVYAYSLSRREIRTLFAKLFRRLASHPLDFIRPPRAVQAVPQPPR